MGFIKGLSRWSERLLTVVVFVFMLALLVVSHVVAPAAYLTGRMIRSLTGMSTLVYRSRTEQMDLAKSARAASREIAQLKTSQSALRSEIAELKAGRHVVFRGERMSEREATRRVLRRVRARTERAVISSTSSAAGEAVPFLGIGLIAAATAYEVKVSCDSMSDLHDLEIALGTEDAASQENVVCGVKAPTTDEILAMIKSSPSAAYDKAASVLHRSLKSIRPTEVDATIPDAQDGSPSASDLEDPPGWMRKAADWSLAWLP